MNEKNEIKRTSVLVTEGSPDNTADVGQDTTQTKRDRLKKLLIFGLMALAFFGCMYLIFVAGNEEAEEESIFGLNEAVPQASGGGLQADKQKAYEEEALDRKERQKREALMSLSDYWQSGGGAEDTTTIADYPEQQADHGTGTAGRTRPALASYHNAQQTLSTFYRDQGSETEELRKEIEELKAQLDEGQAEPDNTMENQLALMEKSYQMAAKYLPANATEGGKRDLNTVSNDKEADFVAFLPQRKGLVSALYRESSDSVLLADWHDERNLGFHTAGVEDRIVQPRNSIRACVLETQTVTGEGEVRLHLLEAARTPHGTIPERTELTAMAKFQDGRLHLHINSIEHGGNIIPTDIAIYDLNGQRGLSVHYTPEMGALTEMAGNMSQTSGTSLMMTRSAGQQIAADLSRGVVQGISGYFSKR